MMNMHLKFDNMHTNIMLNAIICINCHVITSICRVEKILPVGDGGRKKKSREFLFM